MQALKNIKGHIIISSEIDDEIQRLENELKPFRIVKFIEENFKIEHAKEVTKEAYISEIKTKYIVLAALEFTTVAQNALLKLLEEPPRNIEFIIISPTKSNLLPTVRSRLPILQTSKTIKRVQVDLNLAKINYKEVFIFLKEHIKIKKNDAKILVESIFYRATVTQMLILTPTQLSNFDKAYRLLELNSRPQSVLAMLLMSFEKNK